jgi:hydrogenase maturation protein HypF
VQGVGFRPFVYRLAQELGLGGWVLNSGAGLEIEVEGGPEATAEFLLRLDRDKPPPAVVLTREISRLEPRGYQTFEIRPSGADAARTTSVLADLATCPACLGELLDPANRRHLYAFTNCTRCGPRYTIVLDIPYDRPNTTMRGFRLCPDCRREYFNPADRRFHAQPNACPACGPRLDLPVEEAARALGAGLIVALKGIGGFQLLADARSSPAVVRLRRRKHREEKPFALMMPDLDSVRRWCRVSPDEEDVLRSPAAPIVLLEPSGEPGIAPEAAMSSPFLGVMLPYSPLHHLLMRAFPHPVVATSGNRSDEPIAIANEEARERLTGIADVFLAHDRPIARPVDDSVVRLSRGRVQPFRRARGYAPLPVRVPFEMPPLLAVGAHLKNTVAIAVGRQVYVSQHIGDLDTLEARRGFARAIEDLCRLYAFRPEAVVCDLHPDYASTLWARSCGLPVIAVQHHHAHVAACAAENDLDAPWLGVGWDGTGYGLDGSIWGGEFFRRDGASLERVAHLRPFRLPGGEAAIRQAWRSAASLRWELGMEPECPGPVRRMLERNLNCPLTSSVGRLFDAVAALAGIARESRFEGQAAMLLERAIGGLRTDEAYPLPAGDWAPLVRAVDRDVSRGIPAGRIAARFHNSLAEWIREEARRAGLRRIIMSGGVFQNRYLTERAAALLEADGFTVFTHQRVPPNDGGIALGQAVLGAPEFYHVSRNSGETG